MVHPEIIVPGVYNKMVKRILQNKPRWETIAVYGIPLVLGLFFFILYGWMQMSSIYGGDAGEFTTYAYLWGIPHSPGYPLYTFLSGLFIRMLSYGTVAWRAGLLSSVPSAMVIFFLWRLCFRLTRSLFVSTIASVLYGLLGPVWLNAITQEVFGLFSLFAIVWMERYIAWTEEKKVQQLLFLAFWTGLSLTHHQLIILYILPALYLTLWRFEALRKQLFAHWWHILVWGCIGFSPYLYAPFASRFGVAFDQDNAATIDGFIRLVTRVSTGSFRAYANAAPSLIDRALNIFTFFQFSLRDLGYIGCVVVFIGLAAFRKNMRDKYDYLIGCLFSWIFYFFYAGFPSILNYHIGTIERFFIVPYQVLIIFWAIGLSACFQVILRSLKYSMVRMTAVGVLLVILIYSVFPQFQRTSSAFVTLHTDRSMEQLADDLASSAPKNSIVFLYNDTTVFAMNEALFVRHLRQDLHLIRLQNFGLPHYRAYVRRKYPDLYFPAEAVNISTPLIVADFITQNVQKFPIVSDKQVPEISGLWIPNGLLYVYLPDEKAVIDHGELVRANETLWKGFSIPMHLLRYQKELPMLSDILRIYSQQQLNFTIECIVANLPIERIKEELSQSLELAINVVPEQYLRAVSLLISERRCSDAKLLLGVFHDKWGNDRTVLETYDAWGQACGQDPEVDALIQLYRKHFPQKSGSLSQ